MNKPRHGNEHSRHLERRIAKKPKEITRDEYRTVARNAQTIKEGAAVARKWIAEGLITIRSR